MITDNFHAQQLRFMYLYPYPTRKKSAWHNPGNRQLSILPRSDTVFFYISLTISFNKTVFYGFWSIRLRWKFVVRYSTLLCFKRHARELKCLGDIYVQLPHIHVITFNLQWRSSGVENGINSETENSTLSLLQLYKQIKAKLYS